MKRAEALLFGAALTATAICGQGGAATLAEECVISLKSCFDEGKYVFMPDFTALASIEGKTTVSGFVPSIFAFLNKGEEPEVAISSNAATTQYQGHYVWKVDQLVSGFGTYTASKTSRSFGWVFKNDTGGALELTELEFTFGQWGARNAQVDTLSYEWQVSAQPIDTGCSDGWTCSAEDSFASPYTTASPDSAFPIFAYHRAVSYPRHLGVGAYLTVRFTDTCPSSGSNAHLGLSFLRICFKPIGRGFIYTLH